MYFGIFVLFGACLILVSTGSVTAASDVEWRIYKLNLNDQEYNIPYKIINGAVSDIIVDIAFQQITVALLDAGEGTIEISIPRQLIDTKLNGKDDIFVVEIDGEDANYAEIKSTPCFRMLSIEFPEESEHIAIIGEEISTTPTQVPPVYITTDKQNYESGETIKVSGCTDMSFHDKEVVVDVTNPEGMTYKTVDMTPDMDGSFSFSLVVDGENAIEGTYTAKATYAGESAVSTFTVPEFPVSVMIASLAVGLMVGLMRLRNVKLLHR